MSQRHADSAAGGSSAHDAPRVARPLLTVLRGEPTPEQLAALIAVMSARAAAAGDDAGAEPPSPWARPQHRPPVHPDPGAWHASALPR